MADAATTIYAFVKPEVGASADSWGGKLNGDFDDLDALLGVLTTTGSSNAYVLTTGLSLAAYVSGQRFAIKANFTNSSTVTIAVDGLATKAITKNGTTALASGDMVSGTIYIIAYDGTQFQLVGSPSAALDATLVALAALTTSAGQYIRATGTDTFQMDSYTTVTANLSAMVGDSGSGGTKGLAPAPAAGDATAEKFLAADGTWKKRPLPRNYLSGCTVSNNGSDATNDIDVAVGECRDITNAYNIIVAAMTKQLDVNWAAGTNQGMRYSGAAIANTTYHIYAATKADGTQDIYADPSAVAATVLGHLQAETGGSAYVGVRRIRSIQRIGGAIKAETQVGIRIEYTASPVADVSAATPGSTNAETKTLTLPTGIVVEALLSTMVTVTNGSITYMLHSALSKTDVAASSGAQTNVAYDPGGGTPQVATTNVTVWSNTSAQIRQRVSSTAGTVTTYVNTIGYNDYFGIYG